MVQHFIGRKDELAFLEEKYSSDMAEFIAIYGRRRIGKTELIHQFTMGKPHAYFQCERSDPKMIVREFQDRTAKAIRDDTFGKLRISGWYELFEEIVKLLPVAGDRNEGAKVRSRLETMEREIVLDGDGKGGDMPGDKPEPIIGDPGGPGGSGTQFLQLQQPQQLQQRKFIIAIDEFPNLAESDKAIPSIFQKVWDEVLSKAQVMLILCGSSIGMMERDVLSSRSPLFGRRTGQILLRALKMNEVRSFFPGYTFEDVIRVYGVCDGIPAYLDKFDPNLSFPGNIEKIVLNKNEYLYAEGEFLLKSEFREYRNYFLILSTIAKGKRSFNEITNATGLDKGLVSKYLSHLQSLHLVEVDRPITIRTNRSRKSRFRISDNYMKFWFRFVHSNRHEIEEYGSMGFEGIQVDFSQFMGLIFEEFCRDHIFRVQGRKFPLVGAWWNRKGDEIDIVALDHGFTNAILGECKWKERNVGMDVFYKLLGKREILETETKLDTVQYYLFSKSGFTNRLKSVEKERNDLTLVGIEEMENRDIRH